MLAFWVVAYGRFDCKPKVSFISYAFVYTQLEKSLPFYLPQDIRILLILDFNKIRLHFGIFVRFLRCFYISQSTGSVPAEEVSFLHSIVEYNSIQEPTSDGLLSSSVGNRYTGRNTTRRSGVLTGQTKQV